MEADGTNVQRLTDQGYAVSPNWSPNGQFLTFSWMRKYGPGEPGSNDLYLMDVASKQWVQLTHDAGATIFPAGRRMAATSCFSLTAPAATRFGPCWPTAPT
jgi:TolB protein